MSSKKSGGVSQNKRRKTRDGRAGTEGDNVSSSDPRLTTEPKEETIDPFLSEAVFDEKARGMAAKDWARACKSLSDQVYESAADLDEVVEEELCEECGGRVLLVKTRASTQLKKAQRALQEYARRYLRALRELNTEQEEKKETVSKSLSIGKEPEKRLSQLAKEKDETERERDRLRAALAAQTEAKKEAEDESNRLRAALAAGEEENGEIKRERDRLLDTLAAREERERGVRIHPPPP